jgi:hypothetical protein
MPDGILSFEHGEIRLAGVLLPGVLKNLSVRGQVRFDEAERDGLSGTARIPMGWEDSDIVATVELLSDEESNCYDKLVELDANFKGTDNGANPAIYTVANEHLAARNIDRVIFNGFESQETDEDDVILAILSFVEHIPVITKTEERAIASDTAAGETTPATTAKEPEPDSTIVKDQSPYEKGFAAGEGT